MQKTCKLWRSFNKKLEALTHANCGDVLNPKGGGEGYIGSTLLLSKKSLVVIPFTYLSKRKLKNCILDSFAGWNLEVA
jgi:hypothetical protein